MKILAFICQRSFARYVTFDLAEAARRVGLDVKWLDLEGLLVANRDLPAGDRQALVDRTLEEIRSFDPDLVFSYGVEYLDPVFDVFLQEAGPSLYARLRKPAAFFFFDFGFPFDRPVDDTTAVYLEALQGWDSTLFVWDETAAITLRDLGIRNVFPFPMAVNEQMFYRAADRPAAGQTTVVFVGGPTPERIEHLEAIADVGLSVYGYDEAGWRASERLAAAYGGEVLERGRLRDIYNGAAMSINITRPHGPASLNMRVFEAMACGSLMITDARAQAQELFVEDREIVVYRSIAELRSKVEFYRAHPDERRVIAEAGMTAVRTRHTYRQRIEAIVPVLRQALVEHRAGAKVREFARTDPEKALRFLTLLDEEGHVSYQRANLKCLEAEIRRDAGDPGASGAVTEALLVNPAHRRARRVQQKIAHDFGT